MDKKKFDEIVNLHFEPKRHERMKVADRAKIFSPFAALKGYEEQIESTNVRYATRPILSPEAINEIDRALNYLKDNGGKAVIAYFEPSENNEEEGKIIEEECIVYKVKEQGVIATDNGEIQVTNIINVSLDL